MFTATVTPFEVALLAPVYNLLFFVNRVVDVIFTLDIFVQFITMTEGRSQVCAPPSIAGALHNELACNSAAAASPPP